MGSLLSLVPMALELFKRIIPDEDARQKASAELMTMVLNGEAKDIEAKANVIQAEINSGSKLAALWRPIMMLVFLALVVSAWFGFIPRNMPDVMIDRIFNLLEIGMGGYIVGRSVEKIASVAAGVFRR